MQTQSPILLSDICGAADIGDLDPIVAQLAPAQGVLTRGAVLSHDGSGKCVLSAPGNENQVTGILLDAEVDTTEAFTDGSITGTVARHGSFKAEMLQVATGTDLTKLVPALRQNGILLEGAISPP